MIRLVFELLKSLHAVEIEAAKELCSSLENGNQPASARLYEAQKALVDARLALDRVKRLLIRNDDDVPG